MAIVFEPKKHPVNWIKILSFLFAIGFIVFAGYFLFFAPSPKLDVVLPQPLERASQIITVNFVDPGEVLGSSKFRNLRSYVSPPSVGALGRANPFLSF